MKPGFARSGVTKLCETCGVAVYVHLAGEKRKRFCSQKCMVTWRSGYISAQNAMRHRRITCICKQCGAAFMKRPSQVAAGRGIFCSRQCLGTYTIHVKRPRISKAESRFGDMLESVGFGVQRNYRIGPWVCDFYVPSLHRVIEFDGVYWHSLPAMKMRDERKDADLLRRGVAVTRVKECTPKSLQMIAESMGRIYGQYAPGMECRGIPPTTGGISMTTSNVERRASDGAELRLEGQGDARTIRGYAAMFDSLSLPLGGFREVVRKGAFKKTIREGDIRALWNHDANFVLGRKSARTLRLEEDDKGLLVRIIPPNTTWANDLMTSIDRGDVSQMSFGFRMIKDKWTLNDKGESLRELLEVQLMDVSPVVFPAYPQTEVHVRAVMDAVLSRMQSGESITTEERAAMALALEQLRGSLLEPGAPHSESEHNTEPGQPHSEEGLRTLQARRLRLLELVG